MKNKIKSKLKIISHDSSLFMKESNNKSGFVLLFTVLISSIVLAIAIGIADISYKEVVLSSSAREGSVAFFSADSGAECALYWDIKKGAFDDVSVGRMDCGEVGENSLQGISSVNPFSFSLSLNNDQSCALVTVDKTDGTKITSKGYNVPCVDADPLGSGAVNPKIVERTIVVTY